MKENVLSLRRCTLKWLEMKEACNLSQHSSQWGLHFLNILRAWTLTDFFLHYLFKDVCIVNSLERQTMFPFGTKVNQIYLKSSY